MIEMKFSIKKSKGTLCISDVEDFECRYSEVEKFAKSMEFELRDDSRLLWLYCTNNTNLTANQVVNELMRVDYLHKNTNYAKNVELALPILANHFHNKYNTRWDVLWELLRKWGTEAIKFETMRRNQVIFDFACSSCPNILPVAISED